MHATYFLFIKMANVNTIKAYGNGGFAVRFSRQHTAKAAWKQIAQQRPFIVRFLAHCKINP
jgi:hypothetical protein